MTAPWPRAAPLRTRRLLLEPLRVDDARELAPLLDDPVLHAFTGGEPETETQPRMRYARQVAGASPDGTQGWLNWVLRDRDVHAALGIIQATLSSGDEGYTAELAWVIATSRQREGLATEAATAAMDWLSRHGVTTFVAHIHPAHAASAAVACHLGLRPTEERRRGEVRWVGYGSAASRDHSSASMRVSPLRCVERITPSWT